METMAAERANPPFDLRRMTYAMGGGQRGKPPARLIAPSGNRSSTSCG